MKYKKRFLQILAVFACVACLTCAYLCSNFAPLSVQHQRAAAMADARTVLAAIRYLMTPEWS
jgi:formate hydrogenlyase subunit 6/NADH:ubiquinone oxidoreductase subunit I